jgi:hypothetical protein
MSKVVEVFIEKVQSLWVCDMPVASHYPSAQLHVNVRKNFFYGPAGKSNFPFEEKYQAPFEKMFNRLAFVHTYPKENPFAISNFWMGTNKCFMDSDEYCSKVKDQRRRVDDPSHYVQYTTYHKNLKRMYSFKSGEVLHYPPLLTPPSIPTDMKDTLVLEINESRLKAVLDSRERHHVPVGIVNENRSCAMNAVYRLMQDIPHMNDILNKVVHSLGCKGGKPIDKDLVCAYVYCGRLLFDKCAQHNVAKNRRNISIDTLTVAFENKVFNHSSAHNDLVELDKDECAGQVLRVLMNFLQKEVYTVDMEKGDSFSNLFKKRFMETYECQVCESSSWTTFFGPAEDNFTVTVAVPKTVDTNLRCLHKPSKDECFDIHLQDLMRLSSKNFNTPLVDLKECKSILDYKKIHEGANLSECSITKQTTFLTSVPYVILELNRTHIVSQAFKKGDPFVTEQHETSVYVPSNLSINVQRQPNNHGWVMYSFVSAICHENGGTRNAHYYVLKPNGKKSFLKISDTKITTIENKVGREILQKKSTILLYTEKSLKPPANIKSDGNLEFHYCEQSKKFADSLKRTPRTSQKRKLRSDNAQVSHKVQKTTHQSRKINQMQNHPTKSVVGTYQRVFARSMGYHTYFRKSDQGNSTPFEQPCLYCDKQTHQFIGEMTYICQSCGADNDINKFKMNVFVDQRKIHLNGNCMGCNSPFNFEDKNLFHTLGEFKYCTSCIYSRKCRCFVCSKTNEYKASDDINQIRNQYHMKLMQHSCLVLQTNNKDLQMKSDETKQACNLLLQKSRNILNDFLERNNSPEESKVLSKIRELKCKFVALHQDKMLANDPFQNYFFSTKHMNMCMPLDIMKFYVLLCNHSVLSTQNSVQVIYNESCVETNVISSIENFNRGVTLFVSPHMKDHWRALEMNLTKHGEVGVTYFDTAETNTETNRKVSKSFIQQCVNRHVSSKKLVATATDPQCHPKIIMDDSWVDLLNIQPNETCPTNSCGLYMIAFLMNRVGKLNTRMRERHISRMKDFLCLSILTSEAFYY